MTSRILYMIFLSGISLNNTAQIIDEKNFTLYSTKDGLSNNNVICIEQDLYGYLWIATQKGLNRFDGSAFQQFYSDSSRNSLPQDLAHQMRWLDKEQLAIITLSGLHIINTRTLESRNLIIPADSLPFQVNRVFDALMDKNGNIFIITSTGFYQFNNKDELVFRYDHFSRKHVETKAAAFGLNIIMTENNTLLLSTFAGPYLYNIIQKDLHPVGNTDDAFYRQIAPSKKMFTIMHSDENSFSVIIPGDNEFSLFDIPNKRKYLIKVPFTISDKFDSRSKLLRLNDSVFAINSRLNGFYLIDYDKLTNSYDMRPQLYFENYLCTSLLLDRNNRLWIGTNKGLFREKRSKGIIELITTPQQSTTYRSDILMIAVSNNKVFAGTAGEGLMVLNRDSLKTLKRIDFSKYGDTPYYANIVNSAITIHKDTLYIGTTGAWVNTKNLTKGEIDFSHVDSTYDGIDILFKDSRNNIYLKKASSNIFYYRAANDKKFIMVDYSTDLSPLVIGSAINIAEDPEGNIWFSGNGMTRFNYRLQKFDRILDSFPSIKTGSKKVTSNLVFDKEGKMYFGVRGNGLIIYDPYKNKFSHITRSDGLPDNTIFAVYLYNNKLWLGTESGLANYDLATKNISSFGTADGIPTDSYGTYSLYYDSTHQQLYGAFKNILFRFNPDMLTKNNSPPIFFIGKIDVTGKETIYHPADKINLSYNHNNLIVNLASINFEDAYQQQFAYRLVKDGNEPWQETGSQRNIIFSNLSPGNHKLQVKVYIRNNSWPEQIKEINIVILPPFWKTTWFFVLIALLLSTIIYYLHRRRINHITQKANVDKLLAQTEMKALHSQMNPHFIFNCLNSIREMILNNENSQASLYLSKFARLIRITLNHSSKPFVSLEDTIDYLQRYLEMEQIRTSNFNYIMDVDKNLQPDEVFLPPMLIQPFIENAIWHGASPEKEMKLSIQFKRKQNELICIIDDDGIGIETSLRNKEPQLNYQSVGISNIRQRMQVLNEKYNLRSTIEIEDKSHFSSNNHTGTIVTLHLPIKTSEL